MVVSTYSQHLKAEAQLDGEKKNVSNETRMKEASSGPWAFLGGVTYETQFISATIFQICILSFASIMQGGVGGKSLNDTPCSSVPRAKQ